jgi:glutamate racemase
VILQPCPGLVEQVERGELESERTMHLLESYLRPVLAEGADTIVLGCTHYPFLAAQIRAVVGETVSILDSGDAVARQVERTVCLAGAQTPSVGPKESFLTTGDPVQARALISRLWGAAVEVQAMPLEAKCEQA